MPECPVCGFDCTPAPEVEVPDTYPFLPRREEPVSQETGAVSPKGKRRGQPKHATVEAETELPGTEVR